MKKNLRRLLAVVLGLILIVNYIIIAPGKVVEAKEGNNGAKSSGSKSTSSNVTKDKELAEPLNEYGIDGGEHSKRLTEKEKNLNTIVYENEDGSETAYIFKEAVKYVDEEGNVKDKSNKLSKSIKNKKYADKYLYVNDQNDINKYFPTTLNGDTGVVLNYGDVAIEMYPKKTSSVADKVSDNMIIYRNVFGGDAQLQYETTFDGFKENIVIFDDSMNTFKFMVEAEGMYIVDENGALNFIKNDTKDIVATISPIYVFDSYEGDVREGETHYTYANTLDYKKKGNGKYEITITVDEDFLENPATVYPVYVDPTASIVASGTGSNKDIMDTPIYNGTGARGVKAGANVTGVIGYVNSSYGAGRMLMKFPGLMDEEFMKTRNYTITSATLNLYDESGQSTNGTIGVYEYTGPEWSESSVYSSTIWNGVGKEIARATFSYPNNVGKAIDIWPIVGDWQKYMTQDAKGSLAVPSKGIILKNLTSESSTTSHKCIKTTENGSKPYLRIKYIYNGCKSNKASLAGDGRNCMMYAFFVDSSKEFTQLTEYEKKLFAGYSVDVALEKTKVKTEQWMDVTFGDARWREVSAYDAELASDEWLVCMRVGVKAINGVNKYDYHFWFRNKNGDWYNKHGLEQNSEGIIGYNINPSTANDSPGWMLGDIKNFYSSKTIYYAIKSKNKGGSGYEA